MAIRLSSADTKRIKDAAKAARAPVDGETKDTKAAKSGSKPRTRRLPGGDGGEVFAFEIPVAPQPKERARTYADRAVLLSAFKEARGDSGRFMSIVSQRLMRTVTPEATRRFEAAVASYAQAAMVKAGMQPFEVPVEMSADFVLEGTGDEWPVAHQDGDLDNMVKALMDGLNGIAWTDDRLVVGKVSRKLTGPKPGIRVWIWPARQHGSRFTPSRADELHDCAAS